MFLMDLTRPMNHRDSRGLPTFPMAGASAEPAALKALYRVVWDHTTENLGWSGAHWTEEQPDTCRRILVARASPSDVRMRVQARKRPPPGTKIQTPPAKKRAIDSSSADSKQDCHENNVNTATGASKAAEDSKNTSAAGTTANLVPVACIPYWDTENMPICAMFVDMGRMRDALGAKAVLRLAIVTSDSTLTMHRVGIGFPSPPSRGGDQGVGPQA